MHTSNNLKSNEDRNELAKAAAIFKAVYSKLQPALEASAPGQYVVINVKTKEHIVARTPEAAMQVAERTFGSRDYCWSKQIGAL